MNREAGELLAATASTTTSASRCARSGRAPSRWSRWPGRSSIDAQRGDHGRAHLVAGAARGGDAVQGDRASCASDGHRVVYVSHRLDELYRICDRVTVLRDGRRRAHRAAGRARPARSSSRMMLGRESARSGAHGATNFGDAAHAAETEPLLRAERSDRPAPAARHLRSTSGPARWSASAGCSAPVAARRPRRSSARCRWTAAPCGRGQAACAGAHRRPPSAPGSACWPRTARPRASSRTCRSGRTSCWPRCPGCRGSAWSAGAKQDRIVDTFMKRLRIKASSPEQKVGELSGGNQQKVLLARWLCLRAEGPAAGRADPRHRRRRQGRGAGADRRAGRATGWRSC